MKCFVDYITEVTTFPKDERAEGEVLLTTEELRSVKRRRGAR